MRKGWVDVELLVATNKIVRAPVDSKHCKCACVCVCVVCVCVWGVHFELGSLTFLYLKNLEFRPGILKHVFFS